MEQTATLVLTQFEKDVLTGLGKSQKSISSKYFYNDMGNKLFAEIMQLKEYYPTNCEYEILNNNRAEILDPFIKKEHFHLIEFGAGDGKKTKLLIQYLIEKKIDFDYIPIDISSDILKELKSDLEKQFSGIKVIPRVNDYFGALKEIKHLDNFPKLVLFLGSNIGNLSEQETILFLNQLKIELNIGDGFLLGVDLKKDPSTILSAYNDRRGITKQFNLNLLTRINEEMGGNFDLDNFYHYPTYDPETGTAKSFLVSRIKQSVFIDSIQKNFHFNLGETIFLEISQKYEVSLIHDFACLTGFSVIQDFQDLKKYFLDSLWKKV